jgi:hypothetical protein
MRDKQVHDEKICFVISPIGKLGSDKRKRSDQLLEFIIHPTVTPLGYKPVRADQLPKPGMITNHVINYIIDSPLVIADLTSGNPNVFYELAIRHVTRRPLVQLIDEKEQIPFDVAPLRSINLILTI